MGINKVILVGNLGKDPESMVAQNEALKVSFSVATSETFKNAAGIKATRTEWHNIVIWGKLASIAKKYLKKGSPIYLEGKIRTRSWDDKDGNKRYTTEIHVDNFQMLGSKSKGEEVSEDDAPF